MKSSRFSLIKLVAVVFVFCAANSVFAGDSLKGLLINLKGWQGEDAQTMSMDMNGVKMTNAVRTYEKGGKTIAATIMVTSRQMGMASFQQMSMTQGNIKIESKEINGFKVLNTHDGNENSGSLTVLLGESQNNSAIFSMAYEGLSNKDNLSMAKKFDWKAMKKAVKKLMK